ncbi:DUF3291 domain-containing protein [soil metagenome]
MSRQLAQLNLARLRTPINGPEMADFVAALENINAMAERSPGFVWRLIGDGSDATDVRAEGLDDVLVNMSVWTDIEPLRHFVYKTAHAAVMARRAKWFPSYGGVYTVLWWVEDGHRPTVAEAMGKLDDLDRDGPTADAFTFDRPFSAEGEALTLPEIIKDCA